MSRPFFGTFWQKLARRNAEVTSIQAAQQVNTVTAEELVYQTIATFDDGCIQDQVLDALPHLPYSTVTGRFRALLDKGYIQTTGETRPGRSGKQQRVLKIVEKDNA
jgi:hypothetical protein